eukprot:6198869-Pleurochrysis_carterae.AAC.3
MLYPQEFRSHASDLLPYVLIIAALVRNAGCWSGYFQRGRSLRRSARSRWTSELTSQGTWSCRVLSADGERGSLISLRSRTLLS